ncbi:MAG: PH domain-containing protein, partial [Jatrophihabitantaceae bacterium]
MTASADKLTFRLPRSAYLAVLFLLFCTVPLALSSEGGNEGAPVGWSWRLLLLLVPVLAAAFIRRSATIVSTAGLRVTAPFGSRTLPWGEVRGLSITGRAVYAVLEDGAVRLPCVRTGDLAAVARMSDGRLPEIAQPVRKYAPSR